MFGVIHLLSLFSPLLPFLSPSLIFTPLFLCCQPFFSSTCLSVFHFPCISWCYLSILFLRIHLYFPPYFIAIVIPFLLLSSPTSVGFLYSPFSLTAKLWSIMYRLPFYSCPLFLLHALSYCFPTTHHPEMSSSLLTVLFCCIFIRTQHLFMYYVCAANTDGEYIFHRGHPLWLACVDA